MDRMRNSFMISGIGDITYDHTFFAPTVNFASGSGFAIINGHFYIFGGYSDNKQVKKHYIDSLCCILIL